MIGTLLASLVMRQVPQINVKPEVIRGLSPISTNQKAAILKKLGIKADLSKTIRFVLSGDQPIWKSPAASLRFQGKLATSTSDPTAITLERTEDFFHIRLSNPKAGGATPLPRYTYLLHVFTKVEGREILNWSIYQSPRIDRLVTAVGVNADASCTIPLAHSTAASEVAFQFKGRYGVPVSFYKIEVDIIPETKP